MATTVDFHRLADAEVMSIRRYYARAGQSAKFISALHDAVARVGTSPGMWSPDALGTRACPLRKFPHTALSTSKNQAASWSSPCRTIVAALAIGDDE